jgi:hypothetical protein
VIVRDSASGARPRNAEVTYFSKGGRTYVLVVQNVPMGGGSAGGGQAVGLVDDTITVDIDFLAAVSDLRDERSGEALGRGARRRLALHSGLHRERSRVPELCRHAATLMRCLQ